jgi:hypothetical protein
MFDENLVIVRKMCGLFVLHMAHVIWHQKASTDFRQYQRGLDRIYMISFSRRPTQTGADTDSFVRSTPVKYASHFTGQARPNKTVHRFAKKALLAED